MSTGISNDLQPKTTAFLAATFIWVNALHGQCKNIEYKSPGGDCYTKADSVTFTATNHCSKNKSILFSLEFKDSTGEWQEVDNDIFTIADKGMKIIDLAPSQQRKFVFNTEQIDVILFQNERKENFRIVGNLYSDDKIEIVESKSVKQFFVGCK